MPKVKINNAQGLVQETGGGIALFGATQSITANATAANAAISSTTSLVLGDSGNNSQGMNKIFPMDGGFPLIVFGNDRITIWKLTFDQSGFEMNPVTGELGNPFIKSNIHNFSHQLADFPNFHQRFSGKNNLRYLSEIHFFHRLDHLGQTMSIRSLPAGLLLISYAQCHSH